MRNTLTLLLIGVIWGSSFILMKKGLMVFTDTQVGAMRMGLAWLVTLPLAWAHCRSLPWRDWRWLLVSGLLGNGIPAFLFTAAQTVLESSLTGMLNSMVPLLTMVIGTLLFGLRVRLAQALGLLVGLAGALMLIIGPGGLGAFRWHALLVVAASTCYAFNINVIRKHLAHMGTAAITSGSFLWVGPWCIAYLLISDTTARFALPGAWPAFAGVAVLAVVGTAGAVLLFNRLIHDAGPLFASMVTYIVPVIAAMWGVLDGEQLHVLQLGGAVLILGGVYLVNRPQRA